MEVCIGCYNGFIAAFNISIGFLKWPASREVDVSLS
jgi:hypothetical protein